MSQWRKDGHPIADEEIADLAFYDGEALCELGGVRFRFTVETIDAHVANPARQPAGAVVLTLRQIDCPLVADPIYLVEFAHAGPLASAECEARQCGQLADALEIADRTARRYLCVELFRTAEELIAGDQAA